MINLDDLDGATLKYQKIPYIIEAYKIFYGEYPSFDDADLEHKKIQLMMTILTEYNIHDLKKLNLSPMRFDYDEYLKIPYSNILAMKYECLKDKIKNVSNLECKFEQLCKEQPLSERARKDIMLISYTIKQELKRQEIDEPIEFLSQMANVLCFRKYEILACPDSITEMSDSLAKKFEYYNISKYDTNAVEEMLNFICSQLRLGVRPRFGECSTEAIMIFNDIDDDILNNESFSGLLSKNYKSLVKK